MAPLIAFGARVVFEAAFRIVAATSVIFIVLEGIPDGGLRGVLLESEGDLASPRDQAIVEQFNLDGNIVERYTGWITNAVQGEFGQSHVSDVEVSELLMQRLPVSLQLMVIATVLALLFGIPIGVAAARWSDRPVGMASSTMVSILQAVPIYVTSLWIVWFVVKLEWRPPVEWVSISDSFSGYVQMLLMPVTALVLGEIAVIATAVRTEARRALSEVVGDDDGKNDGTRSYDLARTVLRPRSSWLFSAWGRNVGNLLSAVLLVEILFGIEGLGRALFSAIVSADRPVVLGGATYFVLIYVAVNAVIELASYRGDTASGTNEDSLVVEVA